MAKSTLQEVLTSEQREASLYLEEDEDFVYLYDGDGKRQAVFSANREEVRLCPSNGAL